MKNFGLIKTLLALALLNNVSLYAEQAYESDWIKQLGTSRDDHGNASAIDSKGNIFITGDTAGMFDEALNNGYKDVFIAKYSNDGTLLWTRQFGTDDVDSGRSIAIDSNDNIFVTGETDGNPTNTSNDVFIAKYSNDGSLLWKRQFGSAGNDYGKSIAIDGNGDLLVTGHTPDNVALGIYGPKDVFITKYTNDGTFVWTKQFGTSYSDYVSSITTDGSNDVYVTGYGASLNGEAMIGGYDVYIIKYSSDGTLLWTKTFGTPANDYGNSITTDSNNDLLITGHSYILSDRETRGRIEVFILKYDSNGTLLWNKYFGTQDADFGTSITTDSRDNIYVTGHTNGTFDGESYIGGSHIFITKHSSSGAHLWNREFAATRESSIITDSNDNVFITGSTTGVFEGEIHSGRLDAFLAKFSSPNTAPVAVATATPQEAILGATVTLDGSQSYDVDADNLTYQWGWIEKPSNSMAVFSDASSSDPTFLADKEGMYEVSLTVNDGTVDSEPANVSVEVITVQTAVTRLIEQAIQQLQTMPDASFSNKNHRTALINKLNVVAKLLESADYEQALQKLTNDILPKVGEDKNAWVVSSYERSLLNMLLGKTVEYLQNDID